MAQGVGWNPSVGPVLVVPPMLASQIWGLARISGRGSTVIRDVFKLHCLSATHLLLDSAIHHIPAWPLPSGTSNHQANPGASGQAHALVENAKMGFRLAINSSDYQAWQKKGRT